jgi:hypothetical protein
MKLNKLIVGDTEYILSKAYREGADAYRKGISYHDTPYHNANVQAFYDWDYGHTNESAKLHLVDGIDVILAPQNGTTFKIDS